MGTTTPHIVFISSEMYPFSKTGGLGDVLGILPVVLKGLGVDVSVVTPFYGRIATSEYQIRLIYDSCPVGYPWPDITASVFVADYHGVPVYFIDRPEYFDRRHYYCTYRGDYFDNCERYIFFSRAALSFVRSMEAPPSIIHAHDWHSALTPGYLHFARQKDPFWAQTSSVLTIHNLAFQGQYSARLFWGSGLPSEAWTMDGAEYFGSFNMLKTGIAYADAVTTVSPSYALEILTPQFGCGLEGILRHRSGSLHGILNGVDYSIWDPGVDKFLLYPYGPESMHRKQECKKTLLYVMGFHPRFQERPLLGFIGRLREQKGIDMVLEIIPQLMEMDVGVIILGEGDLGMENEIGNLVEQYPGQIGACIGYTEEKSHLIMAGADIFLMPSRYEPCGLTQLYSLRYGTLPVASGVGGLKDTVLSHPHPEATGFIFQDITSEGLLKAIEQAVQVWGQKTLWREMQHRAMSRDFSWQRSAREYIELYGALNGSGWASATTGVHHA